MVGMRNQCCGYTDCFLREIVNNPEESTRRVSEILKGLPNELTEERIPILRGLWSTAMAHPDDPILVELGVLECMTSIVYNDLEKARKKKPMKKNVKFCSDGAAYYAAHVLGSCTMNVERHAIRAVRCGSVAVLYALAAGGMTWVEQRVAVRCLSHLASYDSTFVAVAGYAKGGVLRAAVSLARDAAALVYEQFVGKTVNERLAYHRELLTRGGSVVEDRKAEEWASQLQCWSLQVVNCFAVREEYVLAICGRDFLMELTEMWGGITNGSSPAGIGLLRSICYHKVGRLAIADCASVVDALCNVARSSHDWQFMAVDCLLWLLQDPNITFKIFNKAVVALADLAELPTQGEQKKLGELMTEVLLTCIENLDETTFIPDERSSAALQELSRLRRRRRLVKHMLQEDMKITQAAALVLRLEGNSYFSTGDMQRAALKYTEALEMCPLKMSKDRVIILNNRAQCFLSTGEYEKAVSDTTKAICICRGDKRCTGVLKSSLWRRAQAYDMLGLAKESLLDALVLGTSSSSASSCSSVSEEDHNCDKGANFNFYVTRLIRKQMKRTWFFREVASIYDDALSDHSHQCSNKVDEDEDESEWETASE